MLVFVRGVDKVAQRDTFIETCGASAAYWRRRSLVARVQRCKRERVRDGDFRKGRARRRSYRNALKCEIAPKRSIIPRLELMAAAITARLASTTALSLTRPNPKDGILA